MDGERVHTIEERSLAGSVGCLDDCESLPLNAPLERSRLWTCPNVLSLRIQLTTAERCPEADEGARCDHYERDRSELVNMAKEIAQTPIGDERRKLNSRDRQTKPYSWPPKRH